MILGVLKSLVYMILFFVFLRFINYIVRLVLFLKTKSKTKNNEKSEAISSLKMLQCDKCKTYVLKSDAYFINGKVYCKKDHSL